MKPALFNGSVLGRQEELWTEDAVSGNVQTPVYEQGFPEIQII